MSKPNSVQRLSMLSSETELWWDSSPLVYPAWIEGAGSPYRSANLFDSYVQPDGSLRFSTDSLLLGATTNQPLTQQVIEKWPQEWRTWVAMQAEQSPSLSVKEALWRLFIEVAARGADVLSPLFEASEHRCGQICCQVDPRDMTDLAAMVAQARRIHAARPNIMVKMPGTKEGIEGVRILTSEGIPTNVTLGFTVPQLIAVAEAAQAGLVEAQQRGTDMRNWRSCAVMMLGRYEDCPVFVQQARALDIELDEADLRWAGIAIFRKAHRLYRERGYPSKLMAASMRLGPTLEGVQHVWHLEKLAGANAVLTVFPNIYECFLVNYEQLPVTPQIEKPVPDAVMEKLLRIPYFSEAYDEQGIAAEDFVHHPALQATAAAFCQSMEEIERFAAESIMQK